MIYNQFLFLFNITFMNAINMHDNQNRSLSLLKPVLYCCLGNFKLKEKSIIIKNRVFKKIKFSSKEKISYTSYKDEELYDVNIQIKTDGLQKELDDLNQMAFKFKLISCHLDALIKFSADENRTKIKSQHLKNKIESDKFN